MESFKYKDGKKLKTSLTIVGVLNDPLTSFSGLCGWKKRTEKELELIFLDGEHFSPIDKLPDWLPAKINSLSVES